MTYTTNKIKQNSLIPPHGGYRNLKSYQMAEIVHDLTAIFCKKYRSYLTYKTYEQMVGAARSGKQNLAEGSQVSGTSKKSELKLGGVARGSLEELLQDYHDFLRQNNLPVWPKDSSQVTAIRRIAYTSNKSYRTYTRYLNSASKATNTLICLIHQTNYLIDQQLKSLETEFLRSGGFTEALYRARRSVRQ